MATKPSLEGVQLRSCCIATVKNIDSKLELASAATTLLAWSPLAFILSSPKPEDVAFSVTTGDWDSLAKCMSGIQKIALYSCAQDCQFEAATKHASGAPKLREFWNGMYAHFKEAADA